MAGTAARGQTEGFLGGWATLRHFEIILTLSLFGGWPTLCRFFAKGGPLRVSPSYHLGTGTGQSCFRDFRHRFHDFLVSEEHRRFSV
jgi:hypothetical protein